MIAQSGQYRKTRVRGRSNHYSDLAIETCLTLNAAFHLPLRALAGVVYSLLIMMDASLQPLQL
ncbi:transposase [Pseudoalteromonas citrea]|uniref:transposase n=1 Tax=Pseudoalteromonas citrea TaxID=43655 RepID=UPI0009FC9D02|nr:transposase [Pseudoalteromonas citrea]